LATLLDGRVLIVGGRAGAGDGSLIAAPAPCCCSIPGPTPVAKNDIGFTPRHSLGAAGLTTAGGFKVYAVGGYTGTAPGTAPTDLVEEYDVTTDTWRVVANLPVASAEFGITTTGPAQPRRAHPADARGRRQHRLAADAERHRFRLRLRAQCRQRRLEDADLRHHAAAQPRRGRRRARGPSLPRLRDRRA
jgi:hypothetical protein